MALCVGCEEQALLRAMYEAGLEAVFVKVAALGLVPKKHLGKTLRQMEPVLHRLHRCAIRYLLRERQGRALPLPLQADGCCAENLTLLSCSIPPCLSLTRAQSSLARCRSALILSACSTHTRRLLPASSEPMPLTFSTLYTLHPCSPLPHPTLIRPSGGCGVRV